MSRKHLFISADEIREHYPFADSLQFVDLSPTMKQAELDFFLPYVDADTWTALLTEIDNESATAPWVELADRALRAAAHLIALRHMDKGNVIYSASGLLVAKTTNTVPASEYRTQQLRRSLTDDAQAMLGQFFAWLEDNTAIFTDWAESVERTEGASLILRSAQEFDEHYPFGENRYLWRMLIPIQRRVIRSEIRAELGPDVVAEIVSWRKNGSPSEYTEIIEELGGAIAYISIANALPVIQQRWGAMGIASFDTEDLIQSPRRTGDEASRVNYLRNYALEKGMSDLMSVKHYLDKHASSTKFATYFESDRYTDPGIDIHNPNDPDDPKAGYFAL